MSADPFKDPISPSVTFDSYVIPNTVQVLKQPAAAVLPRVNTPVIAFSIIAVLTFLLGIMTTLQFMGPRQVIVTNAAIQPGTDSLSQIVNASLQDDVTRQDTTDLLATPAASQRAQTGVPSLAAAVLQGLTPQRTIGKLTKDEMALKAQEAIAIVSRNKLRMLREGVLAGLYTVESANKDGKKRIVLTTVNADLTSQSMANLLRKAGEEGLIDIPKSLNTAEGKLDMDTLLFNLVQTSLASDGTTAGAEAARQMSRLAFAASSAKTREVKGERVYIVESGDSLAYISLQFYGKPSEFTRIFEANRSVLASPDRIQIGQRLIIPS